MNATQRRFNAVLHTLTDRDYLVAKIAYEAAPTISGIKPASLVTFCRHERDIYDTWKRHKVETCAALGCQYYELKKTGNYILVLFYNPRLLDQIVAADDNKAFLHALGYKPGISPEQILPVLQARFASDAFPHELGLLLGIPKADVVSFIENQGAGCLFCGYWKVYNNPDWARGIFQEYDEAKHRVMHSICEFKERMDTPA